MSRQWDNDQISTDRRTTKAIARRYDQIRIGPFRETHGETLQRF